MIYSSDVFLNDIPSIEELAKMADSLSLSDCFGNRDLMNQILKQIEQMQCTIIDNLFTHFEKWQVVAYHPDFEGA